MSKKPDPVVAIYNHAFLDLEEERQVFPDLYIIILKGMYKYSLFEWLNLKIWVGHNRYRIFAQIAKVLEERSIRKLEA